MGDHEGPGAVPATSRTSEWLLVSRTWRPCVRPVAAGRKKAILARRKELKIETLVARREYYRRCRERRTDPAAGTPDV